MKKQGLLQIKHVPCDQNDADLFTKNHPELTFEKHVEIYCGIDQYGKQKKVLEVMWDSPNPWAREGLSRRKCSTLEWSKDMVSHGAI